MKEFKIFEQIKTPKKLLEYLKNNIKYGYVGKNSKNIYTPKSKSWNSETLKEYYLQTPEELLNSKHGLCWDSTELERAWFLNKNYEVKTFYLSFLKKSKKRLPTHTFLAYKNKNNWHWFEYSFKNLRGIYKYDNLTSLIKDVKKKHLEYIIKKLNLKTEDLASHKIIEYQQPKYGINVKKFSHTIINKNEPINFIK